MKGIYKITINNKTYIGKDTRIAQDKRKKDHMRLLQKGEHYNSYMQEYYDKYQEFHYAILFLDEDISNDDLEELEKLYIQEFNSYYNGMNLTLGGEGGNGLVVSQKEREKRSLRYTGEDNPQAKLTNIQFYEIVELLKEGKSNLEIAQLYDIHDRYVSLIRHKRRFKNLWATVKDYTPVHGDSRTSKRKLDYKQFQEIVNMINNGATNAGIEREFGLSSGTGSRIRHRKLYTDYWDKYLQDC